MKREFSVIGKPLPKIDAVKKATGRATFLDDIYLPGMLYGKILRSPYAHAKILGIDTSKAERLPGVRAVITGKELAKITKPYAAVAERAELRVGVGKRVGVYKTTDKFALQVDKVRYVGDTVAAVAAASLEVAEEAIDLIDVKYEKLPAVFDPEEAMEPRAPILHEGLERNIVLHSTVTAGDVEKGLKDADYVFEERFVTSKQTATPLETHASLASYDPTDGRLTLWSSTQAVFLDRKTLAEAFGLPLHKVRVIAPEGVGGGFGNKLDFSPDRYLTSVLSMMTGKPVKIVLTREEETGAGITRHPIVIESKLGVKKNGKIVAHKCKVIGDTGAYVSDGPGVINSCGRFLHEVYRTPNVSSDMYLVCTNKTIAGAFRGFGVPQAQFALEQMIDIAAEKLGMDPIEFRLMNILRKGDLSALGTKIYSSGLEECVKRAAKVIGWEDKRKKKKPYRGIGIAATEHVTGQRGYFDSDNSAATVKVNPDGTVCLAIGCVDYGMGIRTTTAQVAAEELGVLLEDVTVINADTEVTPLDLGQWGSRSATMAGNATLAAARDAKLQLFELAAKMLNADPEDLEAKNRTIYVKGKSKKSIPIARVAYASHFTKAGGEKLRGRPIMGRGYFDADSKLPDPATGHGDPSVSAPFGAHIAEVEIDPDTGIVKVLRYVTAHDVGLALNPSIVEGQLHGGLAQGLGYALTEGLSYDKETGVLRNPSFRDYKIFTAVDMPPEVDVVVVETKDPASPLGTKGVGEVAMNPTAAAIANAIYDAIGIRFKDLPITPEKILKALKKRKYG